MGQVLQGDGRVTQLGRVIYMRLNYNFRLRLDPVTNGNKPAGIILISKERGAPNLGLFLISN